MCPQSGSGTQITKYQFLAHLRVAQWWRRTRQRTKVEASVGLDEEDVACALFELEQAREQLGVTVSVLRIVAEEAHPGLPSERTCFDWRFLFFCATYLLWVFPGARLPNTRVLASWISGRSCGSPLARGTSLLQKPTAWCTTPGTSMGTRHFARAKTSCRYLYKEPAAHDIEKFQCLRLHKNDAGASVMHLFSGCVVLEPLGPKKLGNN